MNSKVRKEYEKQIQTRLRTIAKKSGYKTAGITLFKNVDGFFLCPYWTIWDEDGKLTFVFRVNIKPYEYDNIFWTAFDIESNITAKESVRAIGAFACRTFEICLKHFEINTEEGITDEFIRVALDSVEKEYDEFICSVDNDVNKFSQKMIDQSGYNYEELIKMVANMHLKRYKVALDLAIEEIRNKKRGGFGTSDKDIYEFIRDYCEEKIKLKNRDLER